MKQNLILAVAFAAVLFSAPVAAQAQNNEAIADVLTNKDMTITWLGVDFSHAIIEDYLDCEPAKFATEIVPAINNLVVQESPKYDFAKFLLKKDFVSHY